MAHMRFCCHGNVLSCLRFYFLTNFPEIQPLLPIGWKRLGSVHLSPSDVRNTQFKQDSLSLCSCEKLLLSLWRSYPSIYWRLHPLSLLCDSLSPPLFPPFLLKTVLNHSLHHITVSLWIPFIFSFPHCLFQDGCRRLRLTLHDQSQAARSTDHHRDKVRASRAHNQDCITSWR